MRIAWYCPSYVFVSFGITPCIGVDYNFRTDTAVALDFLRKYVK